MSTDASTSEFVSVRLAGVDDHPVVVEGVAATVERRAPEITWIGSAASWASLQTRLTHWNPPPDIVLVDLHLRDGSDPCAVIEALNARGIAAVVFTSELRPVPIRRAVAAGAQGVVLKSDAVDGLIDVLRDVAKGNFAASSDLAYVLLTDDRLAARLAPRELQVLTMLADGVPRKSVGNRMEPAVSLATVVTYLNRICDRYRSLGREVGSVTDAVRAATEDGYLSPYPQDL